MAKITGRQQIDRSTIKKQPKPQSSTYCGSGGGPTPSDDTKFGSSRSSAISKEAAALLKQLKDMGIK